MSDYCVVSMDGARARFFTLEPAQQPAVESGPGLVEAPEALISPEAEQSGAELWSDTNTGGNATAGGAHGYDDHREKHVEEYRRRFAQRVAKQAVLLAEQQRAKCLVIVAEKQMLGLVRGELHVPPKATFEVRELARDLSRLSPLDLQGHLASEGLVPPRQRP